MNNFKRTPLSLIALSALMTCAVAQASSHREAPFITENPKVDATDFYMFRSYEPDREHYVTLIANYNPLQDPYGGPNYFSLSPRALYEIHVDNDGDSVEDLTFSFKFSTMLGNNGEGIALPIGDKNIPVPLKNIGAVSSMDSSALNFMETYTLDMVSGDRRTGMRMAAVGPNGETSFSKPLDNVGTKTFSVEDYSDYANSFIHPVNFAGCPAGAQSGRVFVGQRKESFAVNLGEIFDLVNTDPLGPVDGESNTLGHKNITTIALEVHRDCLTADNDTIAAWTTASLPQVRVLNPEAGFDDPEIAGGAWTQVSRLGMPLVNEVVIGLPDKNRFNSSEPRDDAQFLDYVTNPSLPVLLNVLFGVTPPTAEGRPDLVAAFLTGLDGVNADGSVGDMLRLNTALPITNAHDQHNLGVAAGDVAGFPNGRRPGDDVVDAELRVAMGLLCHLDLGLCTPDEAPSGDLPYTDGALQNAMQFDMHFPYLTTPLPGAMSH